MCDCYDKTIERLKVKLTDASEPDIATMQPEGAELKWLYDPYCAILISGGSVHLVPFTAEWTLKNGKCKKAEIKMIASFCPFCGKAFKEEDVA